MNENENENSNVIQQQVLQCPSEYQRLSADDVCLLIFTLSVDKNTTCSHAQKRC